MANRSTRDEQPRDPREDLLTVTPAFLNAIIEDAVRRGRMDAATRDAQIAAGAQQAQVMHTPGPTPLRPQHDVKLLERAEVPWYFSRGHEFDSHCGRILFRLWFLDFGCPACGEGLRATFGHEPVNPGPFGTGVVCALAAP